MKTIEQKLAVLIKIAEKFNHASIKWAVASSLLLYLKGYVDEFHDIDLLIYEEDAPLAKKLMLDIGADPTSEPGIYRSKHFCRFTLDGVEVDIMGNYIVTKEGIDYEVSLEKDAAIEWITVNDQPIPLDSVRRWRRHYDVMGRQAKVELIDKILEKMESKITGTR